MATINQRFGDQVKKLRKQGKLSQLELANKANLDLTTINEIEKGNRDPMLRTIWRIANALGVKIKDIFPF